MLLQVLQALSEGGLYSLHQLATQLDISDELLESMINELVRMGYLRPLCLTCNQHCQHCPEANGCAVASSGRAWALAPSGKRIAQR